MKVGWILFHPHCPIHLLFTLPGCFWLLQSLERVERAEMGVGKLEFGWCCYNPCCYLLGGQVPSRAHVGFMGGHLGSLQLPWVSPFLLQPLSPLAL